MTPEAMIRAILELRQLRVPLARRLHALPGQGAEEALGLAAVADQLDGAPLRVARRGAGFLVQWCCNAYDYPLNVGGRPLHSAPRGIPDHVRDGRAGRRARRLLAAR